MNFQLSRRIRRQTNKDMQAVEEKRFTYKGLPCVILFTPLGYRCGYVGIPKGKKIDPKKIVCHGDITYTGSTLGDKKTDRWDGTWIGFDCGHTFDGRDIKATRKYYGDNKFLVGLVEHKAERFPYPPKSISFCVGECQSIARQVTEALK